MGDIEFKSKWYSVNRVYICFLEFILALLKNMVRTLEFNLKAILTKRKYSEWLLVLSLYEEDYFHIFKCVLLITRPLRLVERLGTRKPV